MKVRIPTPLRSYTGGETYVEAEGSTLSELMLSLDGQFPGFRFRLVDEQGSLRPHMTVFLGGDRCSDLATPIAGVDEVVIMQALSGG